MDQSGDPYINIGTEEACFFVWISKFLMHQLDAHPFLYYAVEEGLVCAERGYYAAGILAFAQILNVFKEKTPEARHQLAHKFLERRPSKNDFDAVVKQVKEAARTRYETELEKHAKKEQYHGELLEAWNQFITRLHQA